MEQGQHWRRLCSVPVLGLLLLLPQYTGAFLTRPSSLHTVSHRGPATPPVCEQWSPVVPRGTARTSLQAAHEESEEGQSLGRDVLKLLDDVDRLQAQAFREVGVLGQPLPEDLVISLTAQGRIGTSAERAALSSACSAGSRGGELAVDALRLRVRAMRLRAEADLAEAQLANEKVNGTLRALLSGLSPRDLLTDTPPPQVDVGAFECARQAYAPLLGVSLAPPPFDAVALPASDKDKDEEDSSLINIEGQRPIWDRREYWDDDLPDLSLDSRPNKTAQNEDKDREEEELAESSPMVDEEGEDLNDLNDNDEPSPPSSWTSEDEEVYLKILSTNDQGASNGSLASPLELEDILYELEGVDVPLADAPDVRVRRIRRTKVDESSPRRSETEEMLALSFLGEALKEAARGSMEVPPEATKIRDLQLEKFLQMQFDVPVALEAEDGEKLRTQVFGKDAGTAFKVQQVIDIDNVFNIFIFEPGAADMMASGTLLALLQKRLEFFQLHDKVSLFVLRFPLETLFDLKDLVNDSVMKMLLDDDLGLARPFLRFILRRIVACRFAVVAVSKPPPESVVETSVLSDPRIIGASLACGSVIQVAQALRFISPPLQQALDTGLGAFVDQLPSLPQVMQGVPPVLVPFVLLVVVHEAAHRIVANLHKVPLGVPTPIIDPWLGYWGSLTPFQLYPPSRRALFDISAAGPLLGSLSSYSALSAGLWLTKLGMVPQWAPLVPLTYLKQSVFIATLTNTILPGAFATMDPVHATVALHPLALAGIWGVTINALSLLPLGRQDGARMVEALIGKGSAFFASTMTFWGLVAAGVTQGRLDLLFGGLVHWLFWGRRMLPCVDESLDVGGVRRFLGVIALMLMLGALLPAGAGMFETEPYLLNNL